MNTRLRLAALALLALSISGCPSASIGTSGTVGATAHLEGLVTLGPTCPVMRENDPACADKPYLATFSLRDASGNEALHFESDAQGHFLVSAQPGHYWLVPQTPGAAMLPRASAQDVILLEGVTTKVFVQFDTGIR